MKDYSNHTSHYAIVDYRGAFAIAEVIERSREDASRVLVKTDRLSISKSISTLQGQIDDMLKQQQTREEQLAFEQWKHEVIRERLGAK